MLRAWPWACMTVADGWGSGGWLNLGGGVCGAEGRLNLEGRREVGAVEIVGLDRDRLAAEAGHGWLR